MREAAMERNGGLRRLCVPNVGSGTRTSVHTSSSLLPLSARCHRREGVLLEKQKPSPRDKGEGLTAVGHGRATMRIAAAAPSLVELWHHGT